MLTLARAAERLDRDDRGLTFLEGGERTALSFAELGERAGELAHGFLEAGLERGDRAVLVLPGQLDFAQAFLGAVRAGILPVPLSPPLAQGQLDAFVASVRRVGDLTGATAIVSIPELRELLEPIAPRFLALDDLRG